MLTLLLAIPLALGFETFDGNSYYVGDPHAHTGVSGDGTASDVRAGCGSGDCGALADVFGSAVEQGLDWVSFPDHVNGAEYSSRSSDFDAFFQAQLAHDDVSTGLLVVPAAEVWLTHDGAWYGHKNVYLFGSDADLAGLTMADFQFDGVNTEIGACEETGDWISALDAAWGPVLLIPHHPYVDPPASTDWSCVQDEWEVAVEVYSEWGTSLGGSWTWDTPNQPVKARSSVHAALSGRIGDLRMAFLGGTDSHNTLPGDLCDVDAPGRVSTGGLTLVVTPEGEPFDRTAIYDAFVEHRTLATSGPALPVDIGWWVDGSEVATLGQEVPGRIGHELGVRVQVPAAYAPFVTDVLLVDDSCATSLSPVDAGTWAMTVTAGDEPAWAYIAVEVDGAAWYGADLCDDGGSDATEWIWASPSWITMLDYDTDDDGFDADAGDCDDGDPSVHPGATETWYDGVDADCDGASDDDADRDGFDARWRGGRDCDDGHGAVHPGAPDRWYDGIDANCDRADDFDADRDGFSSQRWGGLDCDDLDPRVHPGASDVHMDGQDRNCDGRDGI